MQYYIVKVETSAVNSNRDNRFGGYKQFNRVRKTQLNLNQPVKTIWLNLNGYK